MNGAQTPIVQAAHRRALRAHLSGAWLAPSLLGLLLTFAYWPTIIETAGHLKGNEDMGQAYMAPLVAGYVIWEKRHTLRRGMPSLWGIAWLSLGGLLAFPAIIGASATLSRVGFFCSLAGCVLVVGGGILLRQLAFPLSLLLFMVPVPGLLYDEITLPLRLLATRLGEGALELLGFSVVRYGNVLELPYGRLHVIDACSGIRSLLALGFATLSYGYLFEPRLWLRGALVLSSVPIAILLNAVRVTVTAVLLRSHPQWTVGPVHDTLGWIMFFAAFAALVVVHLIGVRLTYGKSSSAG